MHQMHSARDGKCLAVELALPCRENVMAATCSRRAAAISSVWRSAMRWSCSRRELAYAQGERSSLTRAGCWHQRRKLAGLDGAAIPAAQFDRVRRPARFDTPAVDTVDLHDAARLREVDDRLRIGQEGAVVVGEHHGMATKRGM